MASSPATLAHHVISADGARRAQCVLFLHGILGRGSNLQSLAQQWVEARPDEAAVLVDLREHGGSRGFPPPHTLAAVTADVRALLAQLDVATRTIIGHSFGGKVALGLLREPPADLDRLWVLDATPSPRPTRDARDATRRVIDALATLPGSFDSRTTFVAELRQRGVDKMLGQWLAKNLVRGEDAGLRFALDLDAIRALLADHDREDFWPLLEAPRARPSVHFVLAGRSSSVPPGDRARLADLADRGTITLDVLPDAGHWLHSDNPQGLLRILLAGTS
jgi:pimeloyl-ACP methyl ester carboxylesterase